MRELKAAVIAVIAITLVFGARLPARHDRRRPGRRRRQGRRLARQARRQGRRLEADRAGLLRATCATSRAARRRPTTARAPRSSTTWAEPEGPRRPADEEPRHLPARERRFDPACARARCPPTRSPRRPRASTRTSPRPTRASSPAASPSGAGCPARACSTCRRPHEQAAVRPRRRGLGERARAESGPRPGDVTMTDRPERSLLQRDILLPGDPVVAGQARPATGHPQPGHVRGRGRRDPDHADLARPLSAATAAARRPGVVHVHGRRSSCG